MEKYFYEFDYKFNYEKLLLCAQNLSSKMIHQGKKKSKDGLNKKIKKYDATANSWVKILRGLEHEDNEDCKFIKNEVSKFTDKIGCNNYNIVLYEYDNRSFVDWHVDGRGKDLGRVNLVLTPNHPGITYFRDNDNLNNIPLCAKLSAINAYNIEHKYDNNGLDTRILLLITTNDLFYDELLMKIKEQQYLKNESFL